ncbi:Uncharacterised protein [Mycobacteroides abscessus subsp. abscessus]|nr:Uncharacterised protein [Mycobacteroides abscessus subsp. abscessus]
MIGWTSSPERRICFWMWSMGSSPASTAMKNRLGASAATGAARYLNLLTRGPMPGTSMPMRLTISWNIRVWLCSSIISWEQ